MKWLFLGLAAVNFINMIGATGADDYAKGTFYLVMTIFMLHSANEARNA